MYRLIIYGTLAILSAMILWDTTFGHPLPESKKREVADVIRYISVCGLSYEAELLAQVAEHDGFRESRIYAYLLNSSMTVFSDYSYYAYTPTLSRSRIFLGDYFWQAEQAGRASILAHEAAHINRHRRRISRGFLRGDDEAEAYMHQYKTHKRLGLRKDGEDGMVYWDMMQGIKTYVLHRYPQYANNPDIQEAMRIIEARISR